MTLPADIARCSGDEEQFACKTCARREQFLADEQPKEQRWYPQMAPPIQNGRCIYWIEAA